MGLPPLVYDVTPTFNTSLTRNLYGITAPIIITLTILNNIMVVVTMYSDTRKKRSASCIQHSAIACCNSLFGIVQLPVYFYFFAAPDFPADITYAWCGAYRILGYVIPHIIHTISLWQSMGLAIQRFLVFRYPFWCVSWYNMANMTKLTNVITIVCVMVNINRFFDFEIVDFNEGLPLNTSNTNTITQYTEGKGSLPCRAEYRFSAGRDGYAMFSNWFVVSTVHIVPCTILSIVYILLVSAVVKNNRRRQNLLKNSRHGRRMARNHTLKEASVLVLLTLSLVVEIPSSVIKVNAAIVSRHGNADSGSELYDNVGDEFIFAHFFLLLSYYFYVYIYIVMNNEFRRNFCAFLRKWRPTRRETAIELQNI